MDNVIPLRDDYDPVVAEALQRAYGQEVGFQTAARHLHHLHQLAADPPHRHIPGLRRTAVSLLTGVMLMASSGVAVAASGTALPGDALYPLKRGVERAQLLLIRDAQADAMLQLRLARVRLDEARAVAGTRPDAIPRLFDEVVNYLDAANETGDPAVVAEADVVRQQASQELAALSTDLDEGTRTALQNSETQLAQESGAAPAAPAEEPLPPQDDLAGGQVSVTEVEAPTPDPATVTPAVTESSTTPTTPSPAPTDAPTVTTTESGEPTESSTPSESPSSSASPSTSPTESESSPTSEPSSSPSPTNRQFETAEPEPEPSGTEVSPAPTPSGEES